MDTDDYIGLVYKNLKGDITSAEFALLNDTTIGDAKLAATRLDIEATWDTIADEFELANNKTSLSTIPLSKVNTEELADRIVKESNQRSGKERSILSDKKPKVVSTNRNQANKIFSMSRIVSGIAAVFILGLCATFLLKQKASVYNTAGQHTLADNSVVTLRAGSQLRVSKFGEDNRNVSLEGEAFFEVAKDANRPFSVTANNVKITVLGTSFLVKELGANTYIDLIEGKISAEDKRSSNTAILTAGMQAQFTSQGEIELNHQFNNLSSWKEGTYEYKNQRLGLVLEELNLIFDTEITTTDPALYDCTISGIFIGETLNQILSRIASEFEMEVKQDGTKWILAGGKCK